MILILLFLVVSYFPLSADIIKINKIEPIEENIDDNTLVFFNIAEVLMDTESSLGSQAWRKYVRSRVDSKLHDALTLYVFKNVPPKIPEKETAQIIQRLQKKGVFVYAFTSRGRHEWYSTQVPDIDLLTEKLLRHVNVDFSQSRVPARLTDFQDFFHDGIIYATNGYEKGEILSQFLDKAHLRPSKIVFVDDKADSLATVEKVLQEKGIPLKGYAYQKTSLDHAQFDPMVANIQLDYLLSHGKVISDQEALALKSKLDPQLSHEDYFRQVIEKWKASRS